MIGQTPGRRALLFVDNASPHRTPKNLPPLLHTHPEFLPKNTTPLLQPLDLGVIACVKNQYKSMVTKRAVNLLDAGYIDNPYKIDMRITGMWIYNIFESPAARLHSKLLD